MGYAVPSLVGPDDTSGEDHIVLLEGASWQDYERVLAIRGERSAPRITYLEGAIEIMAPGRNHENIKSLLGRLVEVWCLEKGVRFTTLGSWTLKDESVERGAEPDECYVFGETSEDEQRPDLAIEVVWTSERIDKLEVYRKLGVREVWYWRKGTLQPYALRKERYAPIDQSEVLEGIDLAELVRFLDRPTTYDGVSEYRAALRADR